MSDSWIEVRLHLNDLTKKEAVDYLQTVAPHKARKWLCRNLPHIMALDPLGLERVLTYSDPTGETAVRNVMRQRYGSAA